MKSLRSLYFNVTTLCALEAMRSFVCRLAEEGFDPVYGFL